MAKQKGDVKTVGTIDDRTYYKTIDGYMVKAKGAVSKDKILSDPKFARTRENMAEFGNVGKSSKSLRIPFSNLLQKSADQRMVGRLVAQCFGVLKTDTTAKRGKRTVAKGDLTLLNDFEFNNKGILSTTLLADYTVAFTRTTGNLAFDLPAFIPQQEIAGPAGATHYQVQLAGAAINFSAKKNKAFQTGSDVLPWDNTLSTDLSLTLTLPANSTFPVFVLLQIQFFEQVNADYYAMSNGAFNACAVIEVDIP